MWKFKTSWIANHSSLSWTLPFVLLFELTYPFMEMELATVVSIGVVNLAILFPEVTRWIFTMTMLSTKATEVWFVEYHIFNTLTLVLIILTSDTHSPPLVIQVGDWLISSHLLSFPQAGTLPPWSCFSCYHSVGQVESLSLQGLTQQHLAGHVHSS